MRKFIAVLVVLTAMLIPVSVQAAKKTYVALDLISGNNADLELQINEKSLDLDLAKTTNLRVRVKVNTLFTSNISSRSFKVSLYEIVNGVRTFISSQNLTINRGSKKNRILSISAGEFTSDSKTVEFDLFDTQSNLINTYSTTINATNLSAQASSSGTGLDFDGCDSENDFGTCIDEFFNRVTFEARKQRQASTRIIKDRNGLVRVTIPVPRTGFRFLRGNRVASDTGNNNTGGNAATQFGDIADAGTLRLGIDTLDHSILDYDPNSNQLEIGFSTTPNRLFNFDDQGKFGVGVDTAAAFVDVRGGDGTCPSVKINQGTLLGTVQDGALEYDGNDLFFTVGSNRISLTSGTSGATGPQGPSGPQGATGPQGDPGAPGTLTLNNGTTLNGSLTVTGNITAGTFSGPTPAAVGGPIDINGITTIDATNLNLIRLMDSNTGTTDTLATITGGVAGQRIQLQLQNNMNFQVDNAATANTIQWGRNTVAGPRAQFATEIFEFLYDGNAWYLIARYTIF